MEVRGSRKSARSFPLNRVQINIKHPLRRWRQSIMGRGGILKTEPGMQACCAKRKEAKPSENAKQGAAELQLQRNELLWEEIALLSLLGVFE